MAERWTARQSVDLARGTTDPHVWRNMLLKPGDDRSLEWIIAVNQDGQPAGLAGLEAAGYFLREDGVAVRCEGAIEGNVITVVATQSCYNVPGMLVGQVRLANADGSLAVAEGVFTVGDRLPDDPIQDGDAIPGLDALRAMITEMEGAAGEARAAAQVALDAAGDVTEADSYAKRSQSWAVGGTGTRPGEDTDNAKHYAEVAQQGAEAAGYVWFDINDETGEMMVTVTDNLAEDVSFEINENTGELEVIVA